MPWISESALVLGERESGKLKRGSAINRRKFERAFSLVPFLGRVFEWSPEVAGQVLCGPTGGDILDVLLQSGAIIPLLGNHPLQIVRFIDDLFEEASRGGVGPPS